MSSCLSAEGRNIFYTCRIFIDIFSDLSVEKTEVLSKIWKKLGQTAVKKMKTSSRNHSILLKLKRKTGNAFEYCTTRELEISSVK